MKTITAFVLAAALLFVAPLQANPADREQQMYDAASDALDSNNYQPAANMFREVARMKGDYADAATYWLAYTQNRMGQRSEALATLLDLQKNHPKSKWAQDGKALEVEIRQSAGQTIKPENVSDEELKLMALNGLMHTDPERAIPTIEKVLAGNSSAKVKDRAIFVLSQSQAPRAMEVLARLARDGSHPDLQAKALKYLGIMGGDRSRKLLADVYASSNDVKIKKSILRSYMVSGDRDRLLALAKAEPNPELRGDAVSQLGVMGAQAALAELYTTENDIKIRKQIIRAMFIGGGAEKLTEIARTERVPELRIAAIKNLGLMGGAKSAQALQSLYETDSSAEVRKAVIHGLFLQSNAKALVALARKEKDPGMKKEIISKLSLIHSSEATDYLLEYLQ
ncbi:MAG TPA: HEAT repeat domain-containing protein [Thermoanaerobaculia bacterium]